MICKLSDYAIITMGQSPASEFYNSEGFGTPFLQGNRTFGRKYPSFDTWTMKITKMAKKGDVIMSVRAPVGELNISPIDFCLGRGVCSIRSNDSDQEFLYYLLKYSISQLLSKQTGTVFGSVNRNDIENLVIDLPSFDNRAKIGRVLSVIDSKIQINERINGCLEAQAKSYFDEVIGNQSHREGVLSDIAEITMGQSPKGETLNEAGEGTVFFQGRGEFGARFPTIRLFTKEPTRYAIAGDALMSVRAPVGDLNIAHEDCCIGRGLAAVHGKNGHQSFVFYTLLASKEQLDVFNGQGTVFGSINRDGLKGIKVKIPPIEVIEAFEALARPIDDQILANENEIRRLTSIRDGLLPRLMSGEIDVNSIKVD